MNTSTLMRRSLAHYWRTNLAVLAGVVAATAVIGGALLVGDSVRDSLRQMSLDRLGGIDHALVAQRFFRQELAESLDPGDDSMVAPAIVLQGTVVHERGEHVTRAAGVSVYGADERLWQIWQRSRVGGVIEEHRTGDELANAMHEVMGEALADLSAEIYTPRDNGVVINRRIADALGVEAGDDISLLIEVPAAIPRDALLGDRNETVTELPLTVDFIAEDVSTPGRFGLNPAQQLPLNAFVNLEILQRQLGMQHVRATRRNPTEKPARINALFVSGGDEDTPVEEAPQQAKRLSQQFHRRLGLADLSLRLLIDGQTGNADEELETSFVEIPLQILTVSLPFLLQWDGSHSGYISLESERMILEDSFADEGAKLAAEMELVSSPVLVYLLNEIASATDAEKFSMYSVVAGVEFDEPAPFGPYDFVTGGPPTKVSEVVINEWLAEDLGITEPGESIVVKHKVVGDRGDLPDVKRTWTVSGIVKLVGPAADPHLTPYVEGITDADTFGDWRQPFPMDLDRVTDRDEEYWDEHSTTPKVLMRLEDARELFASRYGGQTSFRIARLSGRVSASLRNYFGQRLIDRLSAGDVPKTGLVLQPVRAQGLAAASGTTDFTGLFVGFSFFLIAAALLLIGLLVRLGLERRVSEYGLLTAVGLTPQQVRRVFLDEVISIVIVGGLLGCLAAVGYAGLMVFGLKTWWFGAIGTKFLFLSVKPGSLIAGFLIGVVMSVLTCWWTLWRLRGASTRQMLAGVTDALLQAAAQRVRRHRLRMTAGVCSAIAGTLMLATLAGLVPATEAFSGFNWRVVSFFVVGVAALAGSLSLLAAWLDAGESNETTSALTNVFRLGLRNAARHRGRSVLTASLIASATFVIVAVAAGRRNPAAEEPINDSGNGGFSLLAETSMPFLYDLNTEQGRANAGLDATDESVQQLIQATRVMPFRVRPGEDASCLNLYQTRLPRILGVPKDVLQAMIDEDRFRFADTPGEEPWALLNAELPDNRVPVLGDMNTLMYSLHKGIGDTIDVPSEVVDGKGATLEVAGMFDGSVFQGMLLMSEANFHRLFPDRAGFGYFLIEIDQAQASDLSTLLETELADYGFDVTPVADRLAEFLTVQNTYLSTFQTLGGLGLLLGTLGLGTVMLRNVLERRGELALLRAVGFRNGHLMKVVLTENAFLLLWGLVAGTISALLAMGPHLLSTGADVPWTGLQAMLLGVFAVGMLAAVLAVREAVRTPILTTLRAE